MHFIIDIYRTITVWTLFLIASFIWGLGCDVMAIFRVKLETRLRWQHFIAKIILGFAGLKVTLNGIENLPKEDGGIYAANHFSYLDPIVLIGRFPKNLSWIIKKELLLWPFVGWHLRSHGCIPLDRSNRESAVRDLKNAASRITGGDNLVIFPEGTRSRTGELYPFKKGAFHLSIDSGKPIIPFYLLGTHEALAADSIVPRRSHVYVNIGKPIYPDKYSKENIDIYMNDYRQILLKLKDEADEWKLSQANKSKKEK